MLTVRQLHNSAQWQGKASLTKVVFPPQKWIIPAFCFNVFIFNRSKCEKCDWIRQKHLNIWIKGVWLDPHPKIMRKNPKFDTQRGLLTFLLNGWIFAHSFLFRQRIKSHENACKLKYLVNSYLTNRRLSKEAWVRSTANVCVFSPSLQSTWNANLMVGSRHQVSVWQPQMWQGHKAWLRAFASFVTAQLGKCLNAGKKKKLVRKMEWKQNRRWEKKMRDGWHSK